MRLYIESSFIGLVKPNHIHQESSLKFNRPPAINFYKWDVRLFTIILRHYFFKVTSEIITSKLKFDKIFQYENYLLDSRVA